MLGDLGPDDVTPDGNLANRAAMDAWLNWRRRDCLGCGGRIVRNRDPWVEIMASRDGSYVATYGRDPTKVYATDPDSIPDEPVFYVGVAHQGCEDTTRNLLQAQQLVLPEHMVRAVITLDGDRNTVREDEFKLYLPADDSACPFCGATTALTDEHVLPKWYSEYLREMGGRMMRDGRPLRRLDYTSPVCDDCNTRWMSVLENDSKPLLISMFEADQIEHIGETHVFSVSEQHQIAFWATKVAFLLDALDSPTIPRGFLQQLRTRRRPPGGAVVWAGRSRPISALRYERSPLSNPPDSPPQGVVVTFSILNLVFQVFCHFNRELMNLPDTRSQTPLGDALVRLWPTRNAEVEWPRASAIDLAATWDELVRTAGL